MERTAKWFILRGLAAGAAGGFVAALFVRFVTETQIGFALQFEEATGLGLPPGEAAEFSRGTQHWGGMAATLIFGTVMGLVLGVAVAALHHRLRGRSEFDRGLKVAVGAFVAVSLIPGLKYPPNPPTVGNPDSIESRTTQYLLLMAAAIAIVFIAWWIWERLSERGLDGARRFGLGVGAFVVMTTIVFVAWPASPDAINPPDSEAAPAFTIGEDTPPEVLAAILATARETDDGFLRDPAAPDQPLDLEAVDDPSDLIGVPAAVSTTKIVPHAYTTIVWHFRLLSFAGLALMWGVIAVVYGLLADKRITATPDADGPPPERELAGV
jgi:hypothetical protein